MVKEEQKPLFDKICKAATLYYPPREDASKSHDWAGFIYTNVWSDSDMRYIVLYEGEKRTLRGHDKPEVCWIVIGENGQLQSVASRHLRKMRPADGFYFWNHVSILDNIK